MPRLLVVIPDRPSELVRKGELTPRYYNPGDTFNDVDFLLINDDPSDADVLRPLAGRARVAVHRLPPPSFGATLGWHPSRLRRWLAEAAALGDRIRPDVVRCYAPWLNGLAGAAIADRCRAPLVVSVHTNPDVQRARLSWRQWRAKLFWLSSARIERAVLRRADLVLPVYEPARVYAEAMGARRVDVVYNAINGEAIVAKRDYALAVPPRIVVVGRQIDGKCPDRIVRAAAAVGASVTLVGTGPMNGHLRDVAAATGADATFVDAWPNHELCARLASFDVFAAHSEYWEISKATLEAAIAGLPIVLNRRVGPAVPELTADLCRLVPNTTDAFAAAFRDLFDDEERRHTIGARARVVALDRYDPRRLELRMAGIYQELLAPSGRP
jgi:glycosyltransferase involved in cell wall biosynthesis